MTKIYASDLKEEKRTDAFMGKGFEEKLKEAQDQDCELIVGEFCENDKWEVD